MTHQEHKAQYAQIVPHSALEWWPALIESSDLPYRNDPESLKGQEQLKDDGTIAYTMVGADEYDAYGQLHGARYCGPTIEIDDSLGGIWTIADVPALLRAYFATNKREDIGGFHSETIGLSCGLHLVWSEEYDHGYVADLDSGKWVQIW